MIFSLNLRDCRRFSRIKEVTLRLTLASLRLATKGRPAEHRSDLSGRAEVGLRRPAPPPGLIFPERSV